MWSADQAPTATGAQATERTSILSRDGIDRTGGGAGSPHCSVPPLIPEQAAMLDINKGRTKIRKEPHQITKQLHQQHQRREDPNKTKEEKQVQRTTNHAKLPQLSSNMKEAQQPRPTFTAPKKKRMSQTTRSPRW